MGWPHKGFGVLGGLWGWYIEVGGTFRGGWGGVWGGFGGLWEGFGEGWGFGVLLWGGWGVRGVVGSGIWGGGLGCPHGGFGVLGGVLVGGRWGSYGREAAFWGDILGDMGDLGGGIWGFPWGLWGLLMGFWGWGGSPLLGGGHSRVCTLLLRVSESSAWTYS